MTHARVARKIPPSLSLDVDLPLAGVTALYGPPGAGKTLLLNLIAGFGKPDSGRILLEDTILFDGESRVHVPPRRRGIACIGSHDSLFPHLSLEQNVKFAAHRLPRLERHRRTAEILERFQLAACARLRPSDLTETQKLRAETARALAGEPRLLLLDERCFDEPLVREIRAATAAPILLVTRSLDLCCAAADTLVLIEDGRVVQRGAPRDVLDHPQSLAAARLAGIANLMEGTIAALDPGRNTSRIDFERFSLNGPYIPGHFRGDRVWAAIEARDLRVHPGALAPPPNAVPAELARISHRAHTVQLEFAGPLFAEVSREHFAAQRDNKSWQIEFPVEALKIL
jgi:ABC-type sulfate/molybdate transport systems ATPase subunit